MITSRKRYVLLAATLAVGCLVYSSSAQEEARIRGEAMLRDLTHAAAHFEANLGQLGPQVEFAFRAEDYRLHVMREGIGLALAGHQVLLGSPMQITFLDAPGSAIGRGREELPFGVMHRVTRDGVRRHLSRVPTFRGVEYKNMYSGIDVQYHVNRGQLEYDFVVAPNADPAQIALGLEGVREVGLDADGNLRMMFPVAELVQHKPHVYQVIEGRRVDVDGRYEMKNDGRKVAIVVGDYDANHPLIIDPLITVKVHDLGYGPQTN